MYPNPEREEEEVVPPCDCSVHTDIRWRCAPSNVQFEFCPGQAGTLLWFIEYNDIGVPEHLSIHSATSLEHGYQILTRRCHMISRETPHWSCSDEQLNNLFEVYREDYSYRFEEEDEEEEEEEDGVSS
jgi:hypothetical protein